MCVYVCVCVCVFTCVCVFMCACVYVSLCVCVYVRMCGCVLGCTIVCGYKCICVYGCVLLGSLHVQQITHTTKSSDFVLKEAALLICPIQASRAEGRCSVYMSDIGIPC